MSTWQALVAGAVAELANAGVPSPDVDARELAEYVAGMRFHTLSGCPASSDDVGRFRTLIRRRCARVPLQHLTGRMYFRFLELVSRPGAFIVRPETELVAEDAITEARRIAAEGRTPRVVDLCTGSGAIAISVATEVADARVTGVEKSPNALIVARENNERYGFLVDFREADALEFGDPASFDVVVTNPPYVPRSHIITQEAEADPAMALWGGGEDGLDIPVALVYRAARILVPGGLLVMEHAEEQGRALREAAHGAGFVKAETRNDYTGRPRWLRARLG